MALGYDPSADMAARLGATGLSLAGTQIRGVVAEIDRGATLDRVRALLTHLADGCDEESASLKRMNQGHEPERRRHPAQS